MKNKLTVIPSKLQLLLGLIYLPVELLLLPLLMSLAVLLLKSFLPLTVTQGQFNGIYFAINFVVVLIIFRKFLLQELHRCRERMSSISQTAGLGFLVYMAVNFALSLVILLVEPEFGNVNDAAIASMASQDYWIILVGTVFLVPLTEELLFRGVLFAGLYNRSPLLAYLVSGLVFSAVHVVGYIGQYPPLTLLLCLLQYVAPSICLCWSYAKSDSILTPVIIHTVVNAIGVLSMR